MLSKEELRIILLHKFKLSLNTAEATRNVVEAWGKRTSERSTRLWLEKFRSGNFSLEDEEGRGRSFLIDKDQLR